MRQSLKYDPEGTATKALLDFVEKYCGQGWPTPESRRLYDESCKNNPCGQESQGPAIVIEGFFRITIR